MTLKDEGRAAIIMAYGKAISMIIGSLGITLSAIILLIWRLCG